jgi:hypothetical protein
MRPVQTISLTHCTPDLQYCVQAVHTDLAKELTDFTGRRTKIHTDCSMCAVAAGTLSLESVHWTYKVLKCEI